MSENHLDYTNREDLNRLRTVLPDSIGPTVVLIADTKDSEDEMHWIIENVIFKFSEDEYTRQTYMLELLFALDRYKIYGDDIIAFFKQANREPGKYHMLFQGITIPTTGDVDDVSLSNPILSVSSVGEIIRGERNINWPRLSLSIKLASRRAMDTKMKEVGFEGSREEFSAMVEQEFKGNAADSEATMAANSALLKSKVAEALGFGNTSEMTDEQQLRALVAVIGTMSEMTKVFDELREYVNGNAAVHRVFNEVSLYIGLNYPLSAANMMRDIIAGIKESGRPVSSVVDVYNGLQKNPKTFTQTYLVSQAGFGDEMEIIIRTARESDNLKELPGLIDYFIEKRTDVQKEIALLVEKLRSEI